MNVNCPISLGELIDKISILYVKLDNIVDIDKKINIKNELDMLFVIYSSLNTDFNNYIEELKEINKIIWDSVSLAWEKERLNQIDKEFTEITRNILIMNDKRFKLKNEINNYFNSLVKEEKFY